MEEGSPTPVLPKSYTWLRLLGVGLSVLSLGLAIAFIGYFMTQKQETPLALTPTPQTANLLSATSSPSPFKGATPTPFSQAR